MFKEIFPIFKKVYERDGLDLILKNYTLEKGVYILIGKDVKQTLVITNKKTTEAKEKLDPLYKTFCEMDYYSTTINPNKYLDAPEKKISSNNYLTLFFDNDNVKTILERNPKNPNKLSSLEKIYSNLKTKSDIYIDEIVKKECGAINVNLMDSIYNYFKNDLVNIVDSLNLKEKTKIKIFFDAPISLYEQESKRYLYYFIYNTNKYNTAIEGTLYGLPNFNNTLNDNKPHLLYKNNAPFLMSIEETILQKRFTEYLEILYKNRIRDIYVTDEDIVPLKPSDSLSIYIYTGHYLRLDKDGNGVLHIADYCPISLFNNNLKPFILKDYTDSYYSKNINITLDTPRKVEFAINNIFFKNKLLNNYHTTPKDIKGIDNDLKRAILNYRESFKNWFYKGNSELIKLNIVNMTTNLVQASLLDKQHDLAIKQLNLGLSIQEYLGGDIVDYKSIRENLFLKASDRSNSMEIESDTEYYIAVGMLASYLASQKSGQRDDLGVLNTIIRASNHSQVKRELLLLFRKYSYKVKLLAFKNVYQSVCAYVPKTFDITALQYGVLTKNIFYTSTKKLKEDDLNDK